MAVRLGVTIFLCICWLYLALTSRYIERWCRDAKEIWDAFHGEEVIDS